MSGSEGSGNGGYGVTGYSANGDGILGQTNASGRSGVIGQDVSGGNGIGVTAQSATGTALKVEGVATFTRSGVVTLSAPGTSVLVTVPGGLTTTSHVLATLQTNPGTVAVRAAVPDTANGKVTIYFTGSAPKNTKFAWFVFG